MEGWAMVEKQNCFTPKWSKCEKGFEGFENNSYSSLPKKELCSAIFLSLIVSIMLQEYV